MRKGLLIKSVSAVTALIIICIGAVFTAFASNKAEVSEFSAPDTVRVGETFTVTLTFSASENIGNIMNTTLDYDSSVIEFVSGEYANGKGGLVTIRDASPSSSSKIMTFKLKFEALKSGSSHILIKKSNIYSDEAILLGNPVGMINVSVIEGNGDVTTTTTSEIVTQTQTTTAQDVSSVVTTAPADVITTENSDVTNSNNSEVQITVTTKGEKSEKSDDSSKVNKDLITTVLLVIGGLVIVGVIISFASADSRGSSKSSNKSSKKKSTRKRK